MTLPALTAAVCAVLAAGPAPAAPKDPAPQVFEGKVVPLAKALEKLGEKPDPDTPGLALVAADRAVLPLVKDADARLFFLDPKLHDRPVRLTARVVRGTRMLKVEKVQTVKAGKVYDVDYWCENCQLGYPEPGKCKCCGSDTVFRELPAK